MNEYLNGIGRFDVFSPGQQLITEQNASGNWEGTKETFLKWLDYLEREIGEPDLWAERIAETEMFADKVKNDNFSKDELRELRMLLNKLQADINETSRLVPEQIKNINNKVDYLIESSQRIGRKDWIILFISILGQEILNIVNQIDPTLLSSVFSLAGLQLKKLLLP